VLVELAVIALRDRWTPAESSSSGNADGREISSPLTMALPRADRYTSLTRNPNPTKANSHAALSSGMAVVDFADYLEYVSIGGMFLSHLSTKKL
jgi:hypothetical protein